MSKFVVVYYTMSDGTATVEIEADNADAARAEIEAHEDCDMVVSAAQVIEW